MSVDYRNLMPCSAAVESFDDVINYYSGNHSGYISGIGLPFKISWKQGSKSFPLHQRKPDLRNKLTMVVHKCILFHFLHFTSMQVSTGLELNAPEKHTFRRTKSNRVVSTFMPVEKKKNREFHIKHLMKSCNRGATFEYTYFVPISTQAAQPARHAMWLSSWQ